MSEAENKELLQTLDDAWNAQDLETLAQRHKSDTVVRWPGRPPTYGVEAHRQEAIDFFRTFPDQRLENRPYKVLLAEGDWTCSIARFTGAMTGPMKTPDGTGIPPTGKASTSTSAWSHAGRTYRSPRRTCSTTSARVCSNLGFPNHREARSVWRTP